MIPMTLYNWILPVKLTTTTKAKYLGVTFDTIIIINLQVKF